MAETFGCDIDESEVENGVIYVSGEHVYANEGIDEVARGNGGLKDIEEVEAE